LSLSSVSILEENSYDGDRPPPQVAPTTRLKYLSVTEDDDCIDFYCTGCNIVIGQYLKTDKPKADLLYNYNYWKTLACRCGRCSDLYLDYDLDDVLKIYKSQPSLIFPSGVLLDKAVSIIQNNGAKIGQNSGNLDIIYKDFRDLTKGKARKKRLHEYWDHIESEKVFLDKDFMAKHLTSGLKRIPKSENKAVRWVSDKRLSKLLDLNRLKDWDHEFEAHKLKLRELQIEKFLPYVKNCFGDYMDEIGRVRCVVLGRHIETGQWHGFEVFNRYSDHYKKELMAKFQKVKDFGIVDGVDYNKSVFLTLTYDPSKISLISAWENIAKDWNRFKTRLFQVIDRASVDYVMTVEAQMNGYPHIHVTFFGIDYLLWNGTWSEYKKLKKRNKKASLQGIWKHGFTYVNKTDGGRKILVPLNYMMKCMSNTWGERGPASKGYLTQSLLWFFNRRSYNCGRKIGKLLQKAVQGNKREDLDGNLYKPSEIEWFGMVVITSREDIKSNIDLCEYLESNGDVISGYG